MCPEVRIQVPEPWLLTEKMAVDAIASIALKEMHRVFGEWMKRLGDKVREYYTEEFRGRWQGLWTVGTVAFSMGYRGYAVEQTVEVCRARAVHLRVDDHPELERLIRGSWELGVEVSGRRKKPTAEAVAPPV